MSTPVVSRQRRWQLKQIALGRCSYCSRHRGADGTSQSCRACADRDKLRHAMRGAK